MLFLCFNKYIIHFIRIPSPLNTPKLMFLRLVTSWSNIFKDLYICNQGFSAALDGFFKPEVAEEKPVLCFLCTSWKRSLVQDGFLPNHKILHKFYRLFPGNLAPCPTHFRPLRSNPRPQFRRSHGKAPRKSDFK